jgi:hypothetical protein
MDTLESIANIHHHLAKKIAQHALIQRPARNARVKIYWKMVIAWIRPLAADLVTTKTRRKAYTLALFVQQTIATAVRENKTLARPVNKTTCWKRIKAVQIAVLLRNVGLVSLAIPVRNHLPARPAKQTAILVHLRQSARNVLVTTFSPVMVIVIVLCHLQVVRVQMVWTTTKSHAGVVLLTVLLTRARVQPPATLAMVRIAVRVSSTPPLQDAFARIKV